MEIEARREGKASFLYKSYKIYRDQNPHQCIFWATLFFLEKYNKMFTRKRSRDN